MPRRSLAVLPTVAAILFSGFASPAVAAPPTLAGCPMFPADHIWNVAVDTLALDANSSAYVSTIGTGASAHADFGTVYNGAPNGIPYASVAGMQMPVALRFSYAGESDAGPYPIPADAPIEGGSGAGGDRHVLIVDRDACKLYELFAAYPDANGGWSAGSGAVYDLRGYALRPDTWTSADAAGLPILPGLVRYDEVLAGEIAHALRFTAPRTRNAYVWPARHQASSNTGAAYPPMGQRFRLKAGVDVSGFGPKLQIILRALKKYGMFLADNGSSWYLSGAPDPRWDDGELHELGQLHGSDFEAVDESSLMASPYSARTSAPPPMAGGLVFTPVTPCRLVDSREVGQDLLPRTSRSYAASDSVRIGQAGGSSAGCAIPNGPAALMLTLTAIAPAQVGNLVSYAVEGPSPLASALNFKAGQIIANTTIVAITPGVGDNLSIFNNSSGSTPLVVDVVGYFRDSAAADCEKTTQILAIPPSGSAAVSATCSSGHRAQGGGCAASAAAAVEWRDRRPLAGGGGFACAAVNLSATAIDVTVDALCCRRAGR